MYSVIYFGLGSLSVDPLVVPSFCVWLLMPVCLSLYLAVFPSFFSHTPRSTFLFLSYYYTFFFDLLLHLLFTVNNIAL